MLCNQKSTVVESRVCGVRVKGLLSQSLELWSQSRTCEVRILRIVESHFRSPGVMSLGGSGCAVGVYGLWSQGIVELKSRRCGVRALWS